MTHPFDLCRRPSRTPAKRNETARSRRRSGHRLAQDDIFAVVKAAALPRLEGLCRNWLPGGRRQGAEYVVRNPTRADRKPGSFKVNVSTGYWADFATDARGGDAISLRAYLDGSSQIEAAKALAAELGVDA